jgi:hypothetical protein
VPSVSGRSLCEVGVIAQDDARRSTGNGTKLTGSETKPSDNASERDAIERESQQHARGLHWHERS